MTSKLIMMNRLGLGISEGLFTISCFGCFFYNYFFFYSFWGHFSDTFPRIWDHHVQSGVFKLSFLFWTLGSRMSRNMRKLFFKIQIFFLNLSSKILVDLDLELPRGDFISEVFWQGRRGVSWFWTFVWHWHEIFHLTLQKTCCLRSSCECK